MTIWRRDLLRGVRWVWKYSLQCGNNVEGLLFRINTWGHVPCTISKEHFVRPIIVVPSRIMHSALWYHDVVNSWTSKKVYCDAHTAYSEEGFVLEWLDILKVYSAPVLCFFLYIYFYFTIPDYVSPVCILIAAASRRWITSSSSALCTDRFASCLPLRPLSNKNSTQTWPP